MWGRYVSYRLFQYRRTLANANECTFPKLLCINVCLEPLGYSALYSLLNAKYNLIIQRWMLHQISAHSVSHMTKQSPARKCFFIYLLVHQSHHKKDADIDRLRYNYVKNTRRISWFGANALRWNFEERSLLETLKFSLYFSGSCINPQLSCYCYYLHWHRSFTIQFHHTCSNLFSWRHFNVCSQGRQLLSLIYLYLDLITCWKDAYMHKCFCYAKNNNLL